MTTKEFAYWLQGYFEISGSKELDEKQVEVVKDHLALVFTKVTPGDDPGKHTNPLGPSPHMMPIHPMTPQTPFEPIYPYGPMGPATAPPPSGPQPLQPGEPFGPIEVTCKAGDSCMAKDSVAVPDAVDQKGYI